MNEFTLLPDDPKLTAYVLGELEGEERAQVEAWLSTHPEAQAAVDEIRATAAQLEAAFADEPLNIPEKPAVRDPYARPRTATLLRFPQVYYVVGGLAAACFAVVLALRERPIGRPAPQLTELKLQSPAAEARPEPGIVALPPLPPSTPVARADVSAVAKSDPAAITFDARIIGPGPIGSATPAEITAGNLARANAGNAPQTFAATPPAATSFGYASLPKSATKGRRAGLDLASVKQESDAMGPTHWTADRLRMMKKELSATGAVLSRSDRQAMLAGGRLNAFTTESYDFRRESDFLATTENPLSTFSIDVDTASYANVRRMIEHGTRPPPDAVRIEEMLNYFPYDYAAPSTNADAAPFAASLEVASAPWAPTHRLVRIGLKGREVTTSQRGPANLVFLIDVSGSMNQPNKLPLVKESLRLLLGRLRPDDRVAIVTYAGASGLALPSTPVAKAAEIREAIGELSPGGSTNGAMGIQLAYDIAKANFVAGGLNRVILCTDGDFNVGVTSAGELVRLITEKAKTGVFLTALGFGMGNYKDSTLQQLADAGNGNYGYVDKRREAEKLLVEQVSGTLVTIAKDVKIQVEFNPAQVASYRLIGYEKRLLKKEDFNNDAVDAGEIGAGHTVTALYEVVPVGVAAEAPTGSVDPLKYAGAGHAAATKAPETSRELLTLKVRYKEPAGDVSKKLEFPLVDDDRAFTQASGDFKFASAVAAFGMILRDSAYKGTATAADVMEWAEAGESRDPGGYRAEFLSLVRQAKAML